MHGALDPTVPLWYWTSLARVLASVVPTRFRHLSISCYLSNVHLSPCQLFSSSHLASQLFLNVISL